MRDRQVNKLQSLLPRLVKSGLAPWRAPPRFPTHPTNRTPTPPRQRPAGSGWASVGQLGVSPLAVLLLRPPRRAPFLRRLLGAIHVHGTWLQGRQRRPLSGGLPPPRPRESPPRLLQPDPGGGAVPAPSPPPTTPPAPSRTAAPPTRSASKALEGLRGAAASAPGDRPISGAPGTSSPRPGRGAG